MAASQAGLSLLGLRASLFVLAGIAAFVLALVAAACGSSDDSGGSAGSGASLVVVAYRKATIALADEVVLLEEGRITDRGTHAELLESCPTYVEIVESQQAMEEAA